MTLTINVPDIYFSHIQQQSIEKQMKLYTALMMYNSKQISIGAACEIAEIDRYTFIDECNKHKIPLCNYTVSEVEKDVNLFLNY